MPQLAFLRLAVSPLITITGFAPGLVSATSTAIDLPSPAWPANAKNQPTSSAWDSDKLDDGDDLRPCKQTTAGVSRKLECVGCRRRRL